jgi:SAM-dependent methyltransferase
MHQERASGLAGLLARARRVSAERGVGRAARAGAREIATRLTSSLLYYRAVKSWRTFTFQGRRYRYFYHRYNATWKTERAVEVPIVWEIVRQHQGRRILEVGNVLSHYFPVTHDIVDKYEQAPGVRNEDIVDYRPARPYDLIVSISTLEHVGWDEQPREPDKLLRAIARLRELVAPGGTIVLTLPLAYNPAMDAMLRDGRLAFPRRYCLKRVSADNRWAEVDWPAIAQAEFNRPFRGINGLVIGVID